MVNLKKNLLIVSTDKYPNGNAGAVRTHVLAKLFQKIGYEVTVVALGESTCFDYQYENNIRFISLRSRSKSLIAKIFNYLAYSYRLKKYVLRKLDFDSVMITHVIPPSAFRYLLKVFCTPGKERFYDCVEWFSPEQFVKGEKSRGYILNNKMNTEWIDSSFKVLSISQYLNRHFENRGIESLYIPAILDIGAIPCQSPTRKSNMIRIVYAGSPGKKDYLKEVIDGFSLLEEDERERFELRLMGITEQQLFSSCGVDSRAFERLRVSVKCIGRVPRSVVLDNLCEADFTVLLRNPEQRYAKAGFPTKVVESLAYSTPVICNLSSDLSDYIVHGKNGVIVNSCTAESFRDALRYVLGMSETQLRESKLEARKTAESYFDYKIYTDKMLEFVEG